MFQGVARDHQAGIEAHPGPVERVAVAHQAGGRVGAPRMCRDQSDPAVPGVEEVLGGQPRTGLVVPPERVEAGIPAPEQDDRGLDPAELCRQRVVHGQRHQQQPVDGPTAEEPLQRQVRLCRPEVAQQEVHVHLAHPVLHAFQQLDVEHRGRGRQSDGDRRRGLLSEVASRPVRVVLELLDRLQHPLARCVGDLGGLVEHARDRRNGHPSLGGDVVDRRALGGGPVGHGGGVRDS